MKSAAIVVSIFVGLVVFSGEGLRATTATVPPPTTTRVNVDSQGNQEYYGGYHPLSPYARHPFISGNGQSVVFHAFGSNLTVDDTNGIGDIFVRNLGDGTTDRVSLDESNHEFTAPDPQLAHVDIPYTQSMTDDGSVISFGVSGTDTAGGYALDYVRDRALGQTAALKYGVEYGSARMSADGRFFAFQTYDSLLPEDNYPDEDIYVYDRVADSLRLATHYPYTSTDYLRVGPISRDGRFLVFEATSRFVFPATEPDDGRGGNLYRVDLLDGTTERIDVDPNGERGNGWGADFVAMSRDGRFIAFDGTLPLAGLPDDGNSHVFLRDMFAQKTTLVDVSNDGTPADRGAGDSLAVSDHGRYVSFGSSSANLPGAFAARPNGASISDIYVRDLETSTTERISVRAPGWETLDDYCGEQGQFFVDCNSIHASIDSTGRFVAFVSRAPNLVPDDTNGQDDVFVRDRCPDGSCEDDGQTTPPLPTEANLVVIGTGLGLVPATVAHGTDVPLTLTTSIEIPGVSADVPVAVNTTATTSSGCTITPNRNSTTSTASLTPSVVRQNFTLRCDSIGSKQVQFAVHADPVGIPDPDESNNDANSVRTIQSALLYVAAGDSIVAGTDTGSGDCVHNLGCSADASKAYPATVAARYATLRGVEVITKNISCDGETSSQFIGGEQGVPRCSKASNGMTQLDFVVNQRPDLITLTIGADDFIQFLLGHSACVRRNQFPPQGQCGSDYTAMKEQLSRNLDVTLPQIAALGVPTAMTGYYHVYCRSNGIVPRNVNKGIDELNSIIRFRAARYGVRFVALADLFRGHEHAPTPFNCSKEPWIAPRLGDCQILDCWFPPVHPNVIGQRQIGRAVLKGLKP